MKLGEGVEAAIHSTIVLAELEEGATLPASALADYHGLSASYLLKHLKALVEARILESVSGPAGGYRLARPSNRISLLDIVLAVEGSQPAFRCNEIRQRGPLVLEKAAYRLPCGVSVAMLRAEKAYRAALAATSIADLIADYAKTADPRAVAASCSFLDQHRRHPRRDLSTGE